MPHIGLVSLVVADYDDAIDFYVNKVGFELIEDTDMGNGKRWVIVGPRGARESRLCWHRHRGKHKPLPSAIRPAGGSDFS